MAKTYLTQNILYGLIVASLLVLYLLNQYMLQYRPHVKSIHVINLDKDVSRWNSVSSVKLDIPVQRWPATYGKDLSEDELARQGVGYAMTRSGKGSYEEQGKDRRNYGVVGCYLSHRNLLKYLGDQNVSENYGHLILEDDVSIPSNFLKSTDEWHKHYQNIPTDWDMVYMDISTPVGVKVNPHIYKLKYTHDEKGNWGTHAYLVRHGSIKTKILPWLTHMIDAVDEQFRMKFNEWNVYAVVPGIIPLNEVLSNDSTIQQDK
jgi:GR25 family glycosyltransferase involved in LPS biosynthesis